MDIMVLLCMEISGCGEFAAGGFIIVPIDMTPEAETPSGNVVPTPSVRTLEGVLQQAAPLPSSQQKVPAFGSPHGTTAACPFLLPRCGCE